jgi:hypothetical protein
MKTRKITFAFLIAGLTIGLTATSCKKYEDGPNVSLTSRTERVANTWIISYAEEDGENVSSEFNQYELFMNSSGDATLDANYTVFGTTYQNQTSGTWVFTNDEANLRLDFDDDSQDGEYRILRLTNDELWLKDISQNLELHLLEK